MAQTTQTPEKRRRSRNIFVGVVVGLIAVIAVIWIVVEATEPDAPDVGVTVGDITENPTAYMGQNVTVSGEVEEIYTTGAFTLDGGDWGMDDDLLVVGATAPRAITEDDLVQVTGEVRQFTLVDVERDLGADLDDEVFARWENRPVVVAQSTQLLERS